MSGIYIHIPFCKKACHYCDFHFSTSLDRKKDLVSAINKEILHRASSLEGQRVDTIYFGGGTPSILSYDELMSIFDTIQGHFNISSHPEITLEANPDDLTALHLRELKRTPINRFSIGIQSFRDEDLKMMNRAHEAKDGEYSVKAAQDAGFENITIDLIYAIPGLSMDHWKRNVEKALHLDVPHLSAYCMTIEEKTAFGKWEKTGKLVQAPDTLANDQYTYLVLQTILAGYDHYEVSNFGREGFHSRHNTAYWQGIPYLGIGPSAHSFDGNRTRRWNVSNNPLYIKALEENTGYWEEEKLSDRDLYNEYIMTGLRTAKGIQIDTVANRFGVELLAQFEEEISGYLEEEWMERNGDQLRLTEKGFFLADRIASDLFLVNE